MAKEELSPKKRAYKLHAQVCGTLANPKRLQLIDLLENGEKSVQELTESMGIRKTNVSQHLAVLRREGLVTTHREGRRVFYRIANSKVIKACRLMREVAKDRLAEKESLFEESGQN